MGGSAKGMPEMCGMRKGLRREEESKTSEELQVRRSKSFSYESGLSELDTWLASTMTEPSQEGGQEEGAEKE